MPGEQVTWGMLGCPTKIGLYRVAENVVRVKKIHIMAAENDPDALFTVLAFEPPLGSPEYVLGHRIA